MRTWIDIPLILLLCLWATACLAVDAADVGLNDHSDYPLFVLERSLNANRVVYEAHTTAEGIGGGEPIHAYWTLESGATEPLSALERSFAYGTELKALAPTEAVFTVKAMADRPVTARLRAPHGKREVLAILRIGGRECRLERIFVQTKGTGLWPKVEFVEIFGRTLDNGEKMRERFEP